MLGPGAASLLFFIGRFLPALSRMFRLLLLLVLLASLAVIVVLSFTNMDGVDTEHFNGVSVVFL